jgi:ribosomal subunit interface protein
MMEVTVSELHGTIPESLNEHAARHAQRLDRYPLKAATLAIAFEKQSGRRAAEARLTLAGGPPLIGRGQGATYRNALNDAISKVERQLKRARSRRRQLRRMTADRATGEAD